MKTTIYTPANDHFPKSSNERPSDPKTLKSKSGGKASTGKNTTSSLQDFRKLSQMRHFPSESVSFSSTEGVEFPLLPTTISGVSISIQHNLNNFFH